MARSARKDKASGTIDRVAGRVLEAIGKLTGRRSQQAKGKAARGRGRFRSARGGTKQRTRS
jgi:uncharacterized protein YjbJ (UPF0337 family)